jgi:environmental stress-induced protein Ves
MNYQLIPSSKQITTKWSGGITSQLFIYPDESSVEARDFDFRISTAKVEAKSSSFTPFLGYNRTLLILTGGIQINHAGHYQKQLKQFDQDFFKGDWETSSKGTCVDFNGISKTKFANVTEVHQFTEGG